MKKCPFCAEEIQDEAIECERCRKEERFKLCKMYLPFPRVATCMSYKDAATEFWRCACEYYYSNKSKDNFTMTKVTVYLIGLSLELYFKAFIIWKETTKNGYKEMKERLKKDTGIRHNLTRLYGMAKERGLTVVSVEEETLIGQLDNEYYSHSSFRYMLGIKINSGGEVNSIEKMDFRAANALEISLPRLSFYFNILANIEKEASRQFIAV